ncbi:hypothetical protein BAY59_10835 [Prauserella coralliicola]|nr:hypothetical protein BAY59_10835 [Prauserella coralliicola]
MFADNVLAYAEAGWPCILPVPVVSKHPPPVGFTGAEGRDTTPLDLVGWAGTHAGHSIALRMPDGVIGIDVDHYDKVKRVVDPATGETVEKVVAKRGADTLAEYETRWGPLPPTWTSTARGDLDSPGPSRVALFRVPAGRYRTKLGDAIEIIQRHHRYLVVAPSQNPEAGGSTYRWYGPDGAAAEAMPKPEEFPELPAAWIEGLREGATEAGPAAADIGSGQALLDQLLTDTRPACAEMTSAALTAVDELTRAGAGGRHDAATGRVHHLVQLGAAGHPGVGTALEDLREHWVELTAGEAREAEWDRMLLSSARKAVTVVGGRQVGNDPCLFTGGMEVAAPAPVDNRPDADEPVPIAPARLWNVREAIGTHAFDPQGGLDQTLAQSVLERMYPALRYAADAKSWLRRGPEQWENYADLSEWALTVVAELMPRGSTAAEKGSDERDRAERRKRFMSAGPSSGIAKKMRALVAGGTHPCSLRLSALDAEPDVLWAGGVAWDLRASGNGPVPAQLNPATPHLHAAAIGPENRPTPLWDAFTAAVWPDPALRAWALRVLSIAVTGYPERSLPILLGETGRGKTQVIALLMSVLGSYAHAADPRLLGNADKTHASIVYALRGRRLSFIDEGPREGRWAQERLKQLSGGAELTANEMHKNPITFRPTHTLVLTANDEPVLTDPAVRARVRLIPCEGDPEAVRTARAAIGHVHGTAWRTEAPGVLAALMREAAALLADPSSGLTSAAPEGMRYLAESLATEQDPIRSWVEDETEPSSEGMKAATLYEAFVAWCRRTNTHPGSIPSLTKWGRGLTRLGYGAAHRKDGKYRPLRLRAPGGWTPLLPTPGGATSAPAVTGSPVGDGLVTGSAETRHPSNAQVNPPVSPSGDGLTGCLPPNAHTRTHTHAHAHAQEGAKGADPQTRHPEPQKSALSSGNDPNPTRHRASEPVTEAFSARITAELLAAKRAHAEAERRPRRKPKRTADEILAARESAKAERRAAAIAAAAGERIGLPAIVERSGAVRAASLGEAAEAVLRAVNRTGGELTVDVETTGYPVGHMDYALRTVQLGDDELAVVFDAADTEHGAAVRELLAAAPVLHAHSATADLVPLAHAGLVDHEGAWERMHDTVIPAKLADPASTGSDPGLKQLAGAVLREAASAPAADEARKALFKAGKWLEQIKPDTAPERSGWAQVDSASATMVRYAASDVLDTAALAARLPAAAPEIAERERIAQRMTARVAYRGLRLDGEHVAQLRTRHRAERERHAERVRAFGIDNPGSNDQVGAKLIELGAPLPRSSKSGKPSVAEGVLTPLKAAAGEVGELATAVLDYREHDTALGTFLEPYRQLVERGDGRARPTVYTLGADTGRMSCVRPNLQQVPREGGFRACITADPGELLISADFSSVEIRVMAALSQDPNLMRMLADGTDVHDLIAEMVFGPGWTKSNRYMVKRGVFGWAYGGGIETLARQVGAPESAMAAVVDALAHIAPRYVEWATQIKHLVRQGRTQFPAYSGRVIHLQGQFPHKAPNFAVQGTARELLVDALIEWRATRWGDCVLLPVHDEILAAVPEAEATEATAALVRCMETELYGVAIKAEASEPAFAWADAA